MLFIGSFPITEVYKPQLLQACSYLAQEKPKSIAHATQTLSYMFLWWKPYGPFVIALSHSDASVVVGGGGGVCDVSLSLGCSTTTWREWQGLWHLQL